jgi:tetratricopeptide (TPR) repeat protein
MVMSVINDMLRDLNRRQAPEVADGRGAVPQSLIEQRGFSVKRAAVVLTLVVCISVVAAYSIMAVNDTQWVAAEQNNIDPQVTVSQQTAVGLPMNTDIAIPDQASPSPDPESSVVDKPLAADLAALHRISEERTISVVDQLGERHPAFVEKIEDKLESPPERVSGQSNPAIPLTSSENNNATAVTAIAAAANASPKPTEPSTSSVANSSFVPEAQLKPETPDTISVKELAAMQMSLSPSALDRNMAQKALALLKAGKSERAYRELMDFIATESVDSESRTVLATYLLQQNRLAEAGDVLLNAPIDESVSLRQLKARWHAAMGDHKMALYTLNSALPEISLHPEYYVLLAAYYQRFGWHIEALKTYTSLVEYDDSVADWWAGLALAADRINDLKQAVLAYQQALALPGLTPELGSFARTRLGQLQAAQQRRS